MPDQGDTLCTIRTTYKLSFRIGEGMVVDLDPAVGAGLVNRGLVMRGFEI